MTAPRSGAGTMGFMLASPAQGRQDKPDATESRDDIPLVLSVSRAEGQWTEDQLDHTIALVFKKASPDSLRRVRDLLERLMPLVTSKLQQDDNETFTKLVDALVDRTPPTPALLMQSQMQARAMNRVLSSGDWLTAAQVAQLGRRSATNPSAHTSKWKKQGQIFSIEYKSREYYPGYALDPEDQYRPRPMLKQVLDVFGHTTKGWRLAFWFDSPNSYLDGKPPKECLAGDSDLVIFAAEREVRGVEHG